MLYLFNIELPKNKQLVSALNNIFGISESKSFFICKKLGFSKNLIIKNISKEQFNELVRNIEFLNVAVAEDLLRSRTLSAQKLVFIKSYRGLRRFKGLPARGQRTHTNGKTSSKKL